MISNFHKESAVVTKDIKDYLQETERQLNNKEYYRKVSDNPTKTHEKLIDQTDLKSKIVKKNKSLMD